MTGTHTQRVEAIEVEAFNFSESGVRQWRDEEMPQDDLPFAAAAFLHCVFYPFAPFIFITYAATYTRWARNSIKINKYEMFFV